MSDPLSDERKVVKAITNLDRQLSAAIRQRDDAEQAMSQAYYLVLGRSPEWSNLFDYEDALEEIFDALSVLRQTAKDALP